ncbi:MAG: HDIG domain-containing protein [Planctomycetes bacterium]|nr:HDIG domain-containing protein [Planctomycetota bacterium]
MFKSRKRTKRVSAEKVKPVKSMSQAPEKTVNPVEKALLLTAYSLGIALLIADWPLAWDTLLGSSVLVLTSHFLFACYIIRFQSEVFREMGRFVMVLVLSLLLIAFVRMTLVLDWWSPYFIPISFVSVILAIIINQRFAVEMTGLLLLHTGLCLYGYDDLLKIVLYLFTGSITGILLSGGIRKRSKLINVGLLIGVVHVLILASLAFYMNELHAPIAVTRDLFRGFIHGAVVGFLLTGFLPFIESILGTVTEISLLELSNQNEQPLLRKLLIEAPGTHHHSFVVGILSEAAAETIGANALLCRVGAYFHDIGKINKPEYFIENSGEAAVKHNLLNPEMSTLIITAHTKDGLEMADYYGLPKAIQAFITEHHGTSAVEYFYREALARSEEDTRVSRDAFRYPGPRPRTKETAIVMLADSVEAATRSLTDPAPGRVQTQIHEVIMNKLADSQLDESPLTLRDLRRIEDAFFQVAVGIFHKRPVLPKAKAPGEGQKGTSGQATGPDPKPAPDEGTRIASGKTGNNARRETAKTLGEESIKESPGNTLSQGSQGARLKNNLPGGPLGDGH